MSRVTLKAAVDRAMAHNPTLAVARIAIERSDALIRQARAASLPSLTGNGVYTHLDGERVFGTGDMRRVVAGQDQINANLQLTVPLVAPAAWGQKWAAEDAASVTAASAKDVRRQVALAVARAYLAVVSQHRVVAAVESAVKTSGAHYDYAHTRLVGGLGRAIDEVRAGQELATSRSQLETASASLTRAQEALGILLAASGPVDTEDEAALDTPPVSLGSALDGARGNRTDIELLHARLGAADNRRRQTWTYYTPFLAAVGQPFYQNPPSLVQPKTGWQAQLILSLPLYDGGLRGGVERERAAAFEEARLNLEAATRQAESEVRAAFDVMLRADRALAAARDASGLAHKAVELSNLAYQAGATSNLEVIDAERRARDAEIAAAVAEDAARQARLDLLVASGKFPG